MRCHVLEAIDFTTKKFWTETNESYITAIAFCEMLHKISDEPYSHDPAGKAAEADGIWAKDELFGGEKIHISGTALLE